MSKIWPKTSDYALHRGVTPQAIRKFILLGKIPPDCIRKAARGYEIHRKRADAALDDESVAPTVAPEPVKTKVGRKVSDIPTDEKKSAIVAAGLPDPTTATKLTEAQRIDRMYQALLRKLEYEKRCGELLEAEDVKKTFFDAGRTVRDAILSIPNRIDAQLAATTDKFEVNKILLAEISTALGGLAE